MRVLLLGGTSEASQLAVALADTDTDAVFSYAGRTGSPVAQPLPTRIGGFGGLDGLTDYLRRAEITHVVDATHPFAAQMSMNAHAACKATEIPLLRLERPAWTAGANDHWQHFGALKDIPAALPNTPARIFLAIGKQHIGAFATAPQHRYLLRLVDAPTAALPLPNADVVLARGPFDAEGDLALLKAHNITHIVAKNSGGSGAQAKLDAARILHLPVMMVDRPALPGNAVAGAVADVMAWLRHEADRGV